MQSPTTKGYFKTTARQSSKMERFCRHHWTKSNTIFVIHLKTTTNAMLDNSLLAHPPLFAEPISSPPSTCGMPPLLHLYDNPHLLCDPNRPPFAQSTLLLLVIFKLWDAVVAHVDMGSVTSTWCRVRCSCFVALFNVTRCLPRRLPNGYPSF